MLAFAILTSSTLTVVASIWLIEAYHLLMDSGFGYNAVGIVPSTVPGSQKESPAVFGCQRLGAAG